MEDTVQVGHSTAARAAGDAHQQLPAQVQHVPTVDAHPCRPAAGQSGATRSVLQGIQTRPITGILVARTADCHMAFAGGRGRAGDADAHASQGPGDGWDLSLARLVTWDTQCSPVTTEDRRVLHKDSIGMLWQRRQGDYLAHSCTQRLYVCFVLLQGKVHVNCQPHLLQKSAHALVQGQQGLQAAVDSRACAVSARNATHALCQATHKRRGQRAAQRRSTVFMRDGQCMGRTQSSGGWGGRRCGL